MYQVQLPYDGIVDFYDGDNVEEAYAIIREEVKKAKTFTKKGKNHSVDWANVVASFDIETTKVKDMRWKPGDPEKYHYFNICFCWQFMINDKFIFGRDISNFFKIMDKCRRLSKKFVIYIHNEAYEYNNLADFFNKAEQIFFKNGSTPLFIDYGQVQFRCSAQLTHKSLAQLGKEVGIDKLKSDFDYSKDRDETTELTPEELNYCYRDCLILNKFILIETLNYCTHEHLEVCSCNLPYTQTGYVRNDMRKSFSKTEEGNYILNQTALTEEEFIDIQPALWGGYTHTNWRVVGKRFTFGELLKLLHIDITSAYPWALVMKEFPYKLSEATILSASLYFKNLEDEKMAQIAKLQIYNICLKKGHIPYIPYSPLGSKSIGVNAVEENGKLICADAIEFTCSDVDMRLIIANYDFKIEDVEISKLYFGYKKSLPYSVIDVVLNYFNGKTVYKDVDGKEYDYGLSKQKLNGCYGMAAQSLVNMFYEVDPENYSVTRVRSEYKEASVLPFQWAIYVTAYVREVIYGLITKMPEQSMYMYSDTDSIFATYSDELMQIINDYNDKIKKALEEKSKLFFNIMPKNPKGVTQYLGSLSIEHDDAIEFCTIGSKRYYIIHSDGTADITFSGLRATKRRKVDGKYVNGYNTDRLINMCGSLYEAFRQIKEDKLELPYIEGIDKLSNYNVRFNFIGEMNGRKYTRPCTYTLYPQSTHLSLNTSLFEFLTSELSEELY